MKQIIEEVVWLSGQHDGPHAKERRFKSRPHLTLVADAIPTGDL